MWYTWFLTLKANWISKVSATVWVFIVSLMPVKNREIKRSSLIIVNHTRIVIYATRVSVKKVQDVRTRNIFI